MYQSATKEIHYAALQVASTLMSSRREVVGLAEGTVDLPDGFDNLLDSAAVLSGQVTNFAANRDAFAAYMLSKCKVDMTAPFKALSGE